MTKLEMLRTTEDGVLCRMEGKTALLRVLALHPSVTVDVQRMVEVRRQVLREKADAGVICLTCPASREALAYVETGKPLLRLVQRDELIRLAGDCAPATDEQLREMGRHKRSHAGWKRWMRHILAPHRSRRYFLYGMGLSTLYLLTGQGYYPIPAILCMTMCILCRVYRPKEKEGFLI